MIVSWKMRRVMGKDVKWAGFDMEIWTGPSDRTCSQPQLGKRSLPSPAFLHQHCSSGLKLCETEEGSAVGRCLPYCCHCVAAVAQLCTAQAVIADAVPKSSKWNSDWRSVSTGDWGKQRFPRQKQELLLLLFKNTKSKRYPGQCRKKKKRRKKQSRAAVYLGKAVIQFTPCCTLVWHCLLWAGWERLHYTIQTTKHSWVWCTTLFFRVIFQKRVFVGLSYHCLPCKWTLGRAWWVLHIGLKAFCPQ